MKLNDAKQKVIDAENSYNHAFSNANSKI